MNKGGVMLNAPVPSGKHALELIKPCESAFDFPAPGVTPQRSPVLGHCFLPVALMRCDQFNTVLCQSLIERITVVGAIPNKSSGSSHGDGFIDGSLDKGDFMWTSRSRVHGEWKTMSVCNNHELRPFAPLGLSHFRPPFFATTKVPSMKHSDKSIFPASCRCRASASSICRMTPAFTQRLKRLKQVEPEGNRSGRSAQHAPVRNTHKIPLSTARSLCTSGRPRPSARRTMTGMSDSRTAHCSSVSSSLRAMMKPLHAEKNIDYLLIK